MVNKTATIKGTEIVEKSHQLNEYISSKMTIQEMRFLAIYLAKINARDQSTRVVTFPLPEFQAIMNYGRMNVSQIKNTIDNLMTKLIHVPNDKEGYDVFQLFKKCKVFKDFGTYYISFDVHDDVVELIFELKSKYVKYELWNVLSFKKSKNAFRMYEILKQYEKIGSISFSLIELKKLMGIPADKYATRFDNFKSKVLNDCQKALEENTDISFTYEKITSAGVTAPVTSGIKFKIFANKPKNKNICDDFLKEYSVILQDIIIADDEEPKSFAFKNENFSLLAEACNLEFNEEEIETIFNYLVNIDIPDCHNNIWLNRYHYLKQQYKEFCYRADIKKQNGSPVANRFLYFLKIIKVEADTN